MILRKSMALLGVGSARIDLILQKEAYRLGEVVYGDFSINGGSIEQKLKRIDCNLVLTDKAAGIEKVIDTKIILTSKLINSEELYTLPFTFQLPASISVSTDEISYRFQTKLHFNEGVTSQDQDIIQIL
ncbi:sporulation protein [Peribacillus asahii]|uniref:sporulation protein n=1 Tax=Peribacillus asahii TaxID=228899 RepID=UPI002079BF3A|nr:sporulation protein [Peribacillus asahii]USK69865.1 sporulation protein [Peribacillus asahii]